jgi:hypothetical protein
MLRYEPTTSFPPRSVVFFHLLLTAFGRYSLSFLSRALARALFLSLIGIFLRTHAPPPDQASKCYTALSHPDMLSKYGIRSASAADPRYTNGNYVKPYSNWRGPIWVNTNAMIAYGLVRSDGSLALGIVLHIALLQWHTSY